MTNNTKICFVTVLISVSLATGTTLSGLDQVSGGEITTSAVVGQWAQDQLKSGGAYIIRFRAGEQVQSYRLNVK